MSQRKDCSKATVPLRSSDTLIGNTLRYLADDFEPYVSTVVADRFRDWANATELREQWVPSCTSASSHIFKRVYQLQNFCKRYIFADDAMSQKELDAKGLSDFIDQQNAMVPPIPTRRSQMVLEEAKTIIQNVLGPYEEAKHMSLCKFGSKSALGVPFQRAYLDRKVEVLSGSHAQQWWFTDHLAGDNALRYAVLSTKMRHVDGPTASVKVTAVPKAFNKARMMAPDSVVGGFISLGLGFYIREQLESHTHINLSNAQEIHKVLAQKSSVSGYHATGDLKRASDSFMQWHIEHMLPPDWAKAIFLCSAPRAKVGSREIGLSSRCLMGTGFTFPLQTLLFWSILQAIVVLLKRTCKVFVFGDDLIYPSSIHHIVKPILSELGFIMNDEKTNPSGPFRESCGGDYFHGVDVRPTMPKGVSQRLTPRAYEAMCYSLINQLLRRWALPEIEITIDYLLKEALSVARNRKLCAVPPDAPDFSGVRVDYMQMSIGTQYFHVPKRTKRQISITRVIATQPVYRLVERVPIYYWDKLRVRSTEDLHPDDCTPEDRDMFKNPGVWNSVLKELVHDVQQRRPFLTRGEQETARKLKKNDHVEVRGKIRILKKKDELIGKLATVRKGTQRYRYAEMKVSTWKGI